MPNVSIANPRRRHRGRRHYSPKQLAAGFGGRHYRHRSRGRRRSNPMLATLAGNPRHRRHRRHGGFIVRHRVTRRRNPGMFGGVTRFIDLKGAAYVAGGIILARSGPRLILKVWPGAPQTGFGLYALQLGSAVLGAVVVRMVLKSEKGAEQVATGGIGYVLYSIANDYVLPKIGLAGLSHGANQWLSVDDIQKMGGVPRLSGAGAYQITAQPRTLSKYSAVEYSV